jgi:Family of unknown function (DUF6264)
LKPGLEGPSDHAKDIVDSPVMTTTQPPRRRLADRVVTILLLIAHALLALYTLAGAAGIQMYEDEMEHRCRSHDLDCRNPWVAVAANIGWVGSGLLFSLAVVFAIRWMKKGRLAFYVPLLGFLGQVAVLVAMVVVNRWKPG